MTVLLIYEYNVIAKARRNGYKSNWLGLMNNSADDSNLLEILSKEKIDINKATIKLLPILLKALSRNSYLDKIEEESATRYTPYEKDITTETTITKNIFADTRNWMKTTPSRLYTIEYKTSPIVYFKNPTRNIEYFTKIRKIRDYQRILNYVDKMINEKNYLGTTQPMRNDYSHTEKPYKMSTPSLKRKPKPKVVNEQKMPIKTTIQEKQPNCKCSHKLSELMSKLLNSIQQLLKYFSGSNSKEIFRCNSTNTVQTKPLKFLIEKSTVKNIHKMITENYNDVGPKITKVPSYKTFLDKHKYTIDSPTKGLDRLDKRRDYTVNAIMKLINPNFKKYSEVDINFDEPFSTTNTYVKSSEINDILKESLKFVKSNVKSSTDTVTTVADYILQKGTYDVSTEMRSPLSTFPEPEFSGEDDYTDTTNLNFNFKRLHPYNTEVDKNSSSSETINVSDKDKSYPLKGARANQSSYKSIQSMRKMGNLASENRKMPLFSPSNYRFAPVTNHTSKPTPPQTILTSNYKMNVTSTTIPTKHTKATTVKTTTEPQNTEFKSNIKQNITSNFPPNENIEKEQEESFSKETGLKHIEEAIMILNNETSTDQIENYNNFITDSYQWETVKSEENVTIKTTTLPLGRSTYLEMQRNDWKHEDNNDFDNDLNYIID